jgi:hypothetical protein
MYILIHILSSLSAGSRLHVVMSGCRELPSSIAMTVPMMSAELMMGASGAMGAAVDEQERPPSGGGGGAMDVASAAVVAAAAAGAGRGAAIVAPPAASAMPRAGAARVLLKHSIP